MSQMTDYLENALGNEVLRGVAFAAPAAVYVALFTTAPTDAAPGTEVSGGSYARQAVTFAAPSTPGVFENSADVDFPQATGSWGTVTHFAIFDAATDGNMLIWGALAVSKAIASGDIFKFLAGDLVINFQ